MSADSGTTQAIQAGASAPRKRFPGCCIHWRSPFFISVEEGDAAEVTKFLLEDCTWLKQTDKRGKRTAWHVAAANGHVEVLRALVHRTRDEDVGLAWGSQPRLSDRIRSAAATRETPGPDQRVSELVNGRASWGITPLVLAAERDHAEAVKYLLSVGADPWLGDLEGRNPAHYAARSGAIKALQALLEEERPLTSRACNRNLPGTRYVDSLDSFGFTPLHYATWANRKPAMMVLVGFDANIVTRSLLLHTDYYNLPPGSTPLHIACLLGDLDRVKLLLRAYYETAADLLPSQTALLGTVERRRRARSHPDPRLILTRTQRLPFHIAARAGHRQLLDWLDPSIPLMFLFGGEDEEGPAGAGRGAGGGGGMVAMVGVSRLTVLAAKALHQALLDSLDAAAADIRRHEEAAEARRRRREERRLAREAEAAAQSLKQGKEPPPDGIRDRIRRLMERASKDGEVGSGGGAVMPASAAAATAAGRPTAANGSDGSREESKTGWRPWRNRGARRGRRRGTSSGVADGGPPATATTAVTDGGQPHSPASRSPRRRRRRSAMSVGVVHAAGGGGGAAAAQVAEEPAATAAPGSAPDGNDGSTGGNSSGRGGQSPKAPDAPQPQPQPPRTSGSGALNGSLRLRLFRSSNGQLTQQPQPRPCNAGRDLAGVAAADGPEMAAGPDAGGAAPSPTGASAAAAAASSIGGGGGGLAASLTRTGLLQRLVRGSLRRQSSGTASCDPAQAQLNERLNRVGITIPEGPDQEAAYFTPGRAPRYNMPTQILLPASAFNTSLRASETGPNSAGGRPPPTISETVVDAASAGAVTADSGSGAATASAAPRRPVDGAGSPEGPRGDCGDVSASSRGGAAREGRCAGGSVEATAVPANERVDDDAAGPCQPEGAAAAAAPAATAAAGAAVSPESGAGEGLGGAGSRTASQSTSVLLGELLSRRSSSCRRNLDDAGANRGGLCAAAADGATAATVMEAAATAACEEGSAAGHVAAEEEEARPAPQLDAAAGPSPFGPKAQAAGFTSVEQMCVEAEGVLATDASSSGASSPAAAEPPPRLATRPGSAAAPLRPRPPPLAAPSGDLEEQLLPASYRQGLGSAAELASSPDPGREGRQGERDLSLSPASPKAGTGASAIRSAGSSQMPSRRPSLQLPGAAASTSDSGLPSPSNLLPQYVRQFSGDDTGARPSREGGQSEAGEDAARPQREGASADGAVGGVASTEVGGGAATAEVGWGLSSGMSRVGAGARLLLNSLRNTLRRTSGQHQAQVVPVTRSPRSPSPNRRSHHHSCSRSRTPDPSERRGLSPGRRSPAAAAPPGSPARASSVAAGAEGADRDAVVGAPSSPNASHNRASAFPHPHAHLAARGVRVASGRIHARVSLFGRGSAAGHADSASGAGGGSGAAARRRPPSTAPRLPAQLASQSASAAQANASQGLGGGSEAQAGGALVTAGAAAAAAPAAAAEPGPGAAAPGEGADEEPLRAGDAAEASFSSASSRGTDGAGGGGAAAAGDDDDEVVCPVCLDEAPNLLVQTCRHQLCMTCARDLVKRHSLTPALCPYCRGVISSFKACVAAGPAPKR